MLLSLDLRTAALLATVLSAYFGSVASAALQQHLGRGAGLPSPVPVPLEAHDYVPSDPSGRTLPPYNTTYYFNQLIDHTNPSLGTFQQRYYFTAEYYEPGGSIS